MNNFVFTNYGKERFLDLPKPVQNRINKKLKSLKAHDDIVAVLKRLHHFEPATHRLRVGTFRLILELRKQTSGEMLFFILDVGDRKDIYS